MVFGVLVVGFICVWGVGCRVHLCCGCGVSGVRCRRNQDPGARWNPHGVEREVLVRRDPPLHPADAPLVLHCAVGHLVEGLGVEV